MDEDVKSARPNTNPESREGGMAKGEAIKVFHARPAKGAINYKSIRDRIHERFSKTIAYLAK